jgi:RNA polymerase sigma-70 factor (ECF subfamily)
MENGSGDVLNAFRHGSVDAFETLFRLHQRAVYGWILRIVRKPTVAEDLTIETFWRIHKAHARFEPALGFEGWARRIATHAALDWLRSARNEAALTVEGLPEPASAPGADPAIKAEIRSRTSQALARLPVKLRVAATLVLIEELAQKEVAAALGISVAAVKLRVFRALRTLRKDLEQQGIRP